LERHLAHHVRRRVGEPDLQIAHLKPHRADVGKGARGRGARAAGQASGRAARQASGRAACSGTTGVRNGARRRAHLGRAVHAWPALSRTPISSIRAASSGGRSTPIATRAIASVKVFMPMVSKAMSAAGTITPHGFTLSPILFSLIIVPQFGAGGCSPKPRKDRPAITTME